MDKNAALEIVSTKLTEHRYQHTLGVMETAIILAERYSADTKKAEFAAIFHDYAKFRPKEEMKKIIINEGMDSALLEYSSELWHAPVGAFLVKNEVGIEDTDILLAIKSHTSGRVGMTLLEKVIFLADYIEPGRSFPGVDEVREMAKQNLDSAVIQSLVNTVQFLMNRHQKVFPETLDTYNCLVSAKNNK
jgi:predicted HD superfamily hydrolase involved in NAD metabolism